MEDEEIYTIDVSTMHLNDTWITTTDNSIYIHDGIAWNNTDITLAQQPWIHTFPDFYEIQEMCKDYPALEKAYENFKTIYKMVEQDWIGKQKERNNPPF